MGKAKKNNDGQQGERISRVVIGRIVKAVDFILCIVLICLLIRTFTRTKKTYQEIDRATGQDALPEPPPSPLPQADVKPLNKHFYSSSEEFIFVGGMPGSGVSLMRAILDAHPDVRCGNGKNILFSIIQLWRSIAYNNYQLQRMRLGGVNERVIDIATSLFLFEVMAANGPPAPRLCTSDPHCMLGGRYFLRLLPNMKMVFLIRDLRAAAYSIFRKKKKISHVQMNTYEEAVRSLNNLLHTMRDECHLLGVDRCLPVRYENLVLRPRETMEDVLRFLDLPWKEEVLHHYFYANKTGVFSEPHSNDTDPIYDTSLTLWVGRTPKYITSFPTYYMQHLLYTGYDSSAFPPDYSRLPRYNWTRPERMLEGKDKSKMENFIRLVAKAVGRHLKEEK
ncbi:Sulfotransferase [Halocaridina rubra]|uniref:Protein-tyrosine sulfotransferase n=1 Tax=Halocaridina rubra TaxID=373956 RepID=A0AAN8WI49_HALRR